MRRRSPFTRAAASLAMALAFVFALGSFAPPVALAQDEYAAHMKNGVALYKLNDFKAALAEFEAAYAATPKASPLINQALCYRQLGKYAQAVERLELALSKHGDTMSPEDQRAATQAISDMRALFGFLNVWVFPADAEVTVDGQAVTPSARVALPLGPGDHEVAVSAPRYVASKKTVVIHAGDRLDVGFALAPDFGTVEVIPKLTTTQIEVDDKVVGTGRWRGELDPGPHEVRAIGETDLGRVEVVAGNTVSIDLTKQPNALPPLPAVVQSTEQPTPPEPEPPSRPLRGFYGHANGAVLIPFTNPVVVHGPPSSGGFVGLRMGYRVGAIGSFEGLIDYGNIEGPGNGASPKAYSLTSILVGPGLRLTSPGETVRFVGCISGGLAFHLIKFRDERLSTEVNPLCPDGADKCDSSGVDFFVMSEIGFEFGFDGVLIGLHGAFVVSGTKGMNDDALQGQGGSKNLAEPYDNELLLMAGPRVWVGYSFW
ncbi:MAG: PEGA domain-containing protein [Polyangiaceae bacterium]